MGIRNPDRSAISPIPERSFNQAWGGRIAAAVAILALGAHVLTPLVFRRIIEDRRAVYSASLDPAREAASDVRLAVAREVAAIRGYLLTRDARLLDEYRSARRSQDDAFTRLATVADLDPPVRREAVVLEQATRDWNMANDRLAAGGMPISEALDHFADQQAKYTTALDAGLTLEHTIVSEVKRGRLEVTALEHRWAIASVALAILAAVAAALVVFMMRVWHEQSALARTDPLTRLANRRGFDELATRELSRGRRSGMPLTLIAFDLDGFKRVNDRDGHTAGDQLLRDVGDAIRLTIRDIDIGARLGGDEFALVLSDNRADPPERAVERVCQVVMRELAERHSGITLSVGAVTVSDPAVSLDEMLHHADKLMYMVKNGGKNGMRHEVLRRQPR